MRPDQAAAKEGRERRMMQERAAFDLWWEGEIAKIRARNRIPKQPKTRPEWFRKYADLAVAVKSLLSFSQHTPGLTVEEIAKELGLSWYYFDSIRNTLRGLRRSGIPIAHRRDKDATRWFLKRDVELP